jgi:hypothetical protein
MSKFNKTNQINKHKLEPINKNNALVRAKIKKMIKYGRVEITKKEELEKFPIGLTLISYMNIFGIFKSGGYLYKLADDYFIYIQSITRTKYRVRYKNVDKMWVANVKDVKNDIITLVCTNKKKTKYPVMIGNIIMYYAKDNFDKERFCCTNKYLIMKDWYDQFGHLLDD